MASKNEDDCYGCGQMEIEEHVPIERNRYGEERIR